MRTISFRYDLLSQEGLKIGEVKALSGNVSLDTKSVISRTAKFTFHGSEWSRIDFLRNMIRPVVIIDGKEDPLGVFLLATPTRSVTKTGVNISVDAYDKTLILSEDKVVDRYYLPEGALYSTAISSLIQSAGIKEAIIQDTGRNLRREREWEIGTPKIKIINDLLAEINFNPIWSDGNGYLRCEQYTMPWQTRPEVYYKDDNTSQIIAGSTTSEVDLFNVPNSWVVVASNAETDDLVSRHENTDVSLITSIPMRGRKIVRYEKVDDIADQVSLDAYVQRMAYKDSDVYGNVKFSSLINPKHGYLTPIYFSNSALALEGKYIETAWSIPLKVGGQMSHQVRKVFRI